MGLSLIIDNEQNEAVFHNTTTGYPFGMVMRGDVAQDFLEELLEEDLNPKHMSDSYLQKRYYDYLEKICILD